MLEDELYWRRWSDTNAIAQSLVGSSPAPDYRAREFMARLFKAYDERTNRVIVLEAMEQECFKHMDKLETLLLGKPPKTISTDLWTYLEKVLKGCRYDCIGCRECEGIR